MRRAGQGTEWRYDFPRSFVSRLSDHANNAEIFESDRGTRLGRAVNKRTSQAGTEARPRHLPLGHGGNRFSDRASVDQMGAAGICRHAGEIAAAFVFDLLESEGASRARAFSDRRVPLR